MENQAVLLPNQIIIGMVLLTKKGEWVTVVESHMSRDGRWHLAARMPDLTIRENLFDVSEGLLVSVPQDILDGLDLKTQTRLITEMYLHDPTPQNLLRAEANLGTLIFFEGLGDSENG